MSLENEQWSGRIGILTGPMGAGKSTICVKVTVAAAQAGWHVTGVLSPPVYEADQKVGFEVVNIQSGERRMLAQLRQPGDSGIQTIRWSFVEESLSWGNEILVACVPSDLLVVDELGKLEFTMNKGWLQGLAALDSGHFHRALVVIRPDLLDAALNRWPRADIYPLVKSVQIENLVQEILLDLGIA